MDSYRFLSSSLDKLIINFVDNGHKTLGTLKKEIVDNYHILNIVTDIGEFDRTREDSKKDYLHKIKSLEVALLDYMSENYLKILKDEFGDKWKNLTKKLAYPYEFFNSINDYQKSVTDLKIEDSFNKLKNKCPKDEEIEGIKETIQLFNIKNGKELTEIYVKSDVLLLTCVFEKFIKVSVNEFGIKPLYCVSLLGYTWQCGLKYTGNNLQALQDKDMILLLENNIRGGISRVMGDRYVKSTDKKRYCIKVVLTCMVIVCLNLYLAMKSNLKKIIGYIKF